MVMQANLDNEAKKKHKKRFPETLKQSSKSA